MNGDFPDITLDTTGLTGDTVSTHVRQMHNGGILFRGVSQCLRILPCTKYWKVIPLRNFEKNKFCLLTIFPAPNFKILLYSGHFSSSTMMSRFLTHLPSFKAQTVFFHRSFWFSSFKKYGAQNPTRPLFSLFQILVPNVLILVHQLVNTPNVLE